MLGSIGYALGDMVNIAQMTADQKHERWFSKAVWLVVLLVFVIYGANQSYLCYLSASSVSAESELAFPAVLICPMFPTITIPQQLSCNKLNTTLSPIQNCSAKVIQPTNTIQSNLSCAVFNVGSDNVVTASSGEYSFMEINLTSSGIGTRKLPFLVVLSGQDEEQRAVGSFNFVVAPGYSYYAALTLEKFEYLDGSITSSYSSSISSFGTVVLSSNRITITFAYSSFNINKSSEFVSYDWPTLIGTLGGAAAFLITVHQLVMLIYQKSKRCCCCPNKFKYDETDMEETQKVSDGASELETPLLPRESPACN